MTPASSRRRGAPRQRRPRVLDYVRSRHLEEQDPNTQEWKSIDIVPDIARIGRQQEFIRNLAGVAIEQSLSDPFAALDIADRVQSFLGIDSKFGRDELNQLVRGVPHDRRQRQQRAQFATIPWKPNPAEPLVTLVLDQEPANEMVKRLETFGDTPPPRTIQPSQVKVRVIDATGQGIQTAVADSLASRGSSARGPAWRSSRCRPPTSVTRRRFPPRCARRSSCSTTSPRRDSCLTRSRRTSSSSCSARTRRADHRAVDHDDDGAGRYRGSDATLPPATDPSAPAPTTTTLALGSPC